MKEKRRPKQRPKDPQYVRWWQLVKTDAPRTHISTFQSEVDALKRNGVIRLQRRS